MSGDNPDTLMRTEAFRRAPTTRREHGGSGFIFH